MDPFFLCWCEAPRDGRSGLTREDGTWYGDPSTVPAGLSPALKLRALGETPVRATDSVKDLGLQEGGEPWSWAEGTRSRRVLHRPVLATV